MFMSVGVPRRSTLVTPTTTTTIIIIMAGAIEGKVWL